MDGMTTLQRAGSRAGVLVCGAVLAGGFGLAAVGTAAADVVIGPDGWPQATEQPSAIGPSQYDDFLTPQDADYWNPLVSENRLTSPFGTDTRIECTAFHGVLLNCWQADVDGTPHKLVKLPIDFPGSLGAPRPGGGPSHFVYPMGPDSA